MNKYNLQENINKELLFEIAKIACEENVYVSTIQRKLSVGYAVASLHLEWLASNKVVSLDAEGKTYSMNKKYKTYVFGTFKHKYRARTKILKEKAQK